VSGGYHWLRELADSWGLVAMGVLWAGFIAWAFLPWNRARNRAAAEMIFHEDSDHG
jgi:cytochrome c oxidase cbb3-type subunit 4